ncbi:MAG TPA: NAD-dependent epimerase/dehydratase family protein [Dehalococcoidia bacterium]|nr:NAD-dependent epimerase/dehydratase family protein [Dehalococcoidia bacterium]
MRSLVAGGAGFIGSHLCDALLARGDEVVCIDNLCTGRRDNVDHLAWHPRFALVERDVVEPLPPLPAVDAVFHLASPASPPRYRDRAVETLRVNAEGTRRLLALAEEHGAAFVLASTSEVYGDPLVHPQPETYRGNVSTTGPRSMYDEGKRYAEALTVAWARQRGVRAAIARIFNTYGPRMDPDDGRVVPNFIAQALHEEPMTVYGDGAQTRSLCHVSDTVAGLVALAAHATMDPPVVNLGTRDERKVREIAEIVRSCAESRSRIVRVDAPVGDDPRRRRPDITRARSLLGWTPRVPLEAGLRDTVAWYRERIHGREGARHGARRHAPPRPARA